MKNISFCETDEYDYGIVVDEVNLESIKSPFKQSIISIPSGAISPLDQHEVKETWLIMSGYGSLTCNDTPKPLKKGDAVFFESFDTHQVTNESSEVMKIISTWWM